MKRKTVLVTGSSRGIGRACALAFAGAGYHVFINCRNSTDKLETLEREILDAGGSCTKLPGDVSSPETVRSLFREITASCGGLDVLVNNAGIAHFGLLNDMSDREWRNVLDTNLSSAFYCCREAIPYMVSKKQGRIINISSMWGTSGASCEAAYSASKAGLDGLTRALAKELAPSNIQVNAIACGVIDTEMNGRLNNEERTALEEEIPAGRFGTAEETARLVLMLAEAPSYLTGQVIGMDGGFL
ncbi:MAG TPA: 3-oxoacyl-ACP reductase FabG [Candidatus Mediterraneibacter norfolkensis]|nr:3-oxoacyl-ACP reductase FabG [Candidatus Mediterraneibacter norfolkensis]